MAKLQIPMLIRHPPAYYQVQSYQLVYPPFTAIFLLRRSGIGLPFNVNQ